MIDSSTIEGSKIFINAPTVELMIDRTSYIEVTGRSLETKGTSLANAHGASYIGHGGYCGSTPASSRYSAFDLMPNKDDIYDMKEMQLIGSMGHYSASTTDRDRSTGGGGRIHINVENLNFTGDGGRQLQSNGLPDLEKEDRDDLNGGSGGYIYIKTINSKVKNTIASSSQIEAKGGYGKN
jgi:hypothetical protein